jgi:predicted ATP-grasp superfamily ATP-dependent carboligase
LTEQLRGSLLIVAVSGRALARAAADAGYTPLVADFFADLDTQALALRAQKIPGDLSHGFCWESLEPVLDALCADAASPPLGVIYGSGFEDRPELLDAIAARWRLIGNSAASVAEVNDPEGFFAVLAQMGIPHPESRLDPPAEPEGWIAKRLGAAGGSHVVPAEGKSGASNVYFQRLIPGRPVSALFASDGVRATMLGLSEQWGAPAPGKPWRYGGASRPAEVGLKAAERMGAIVARVAAAFRLKGLNSADFLLDGDDPCLLEINPRPGATLDIFANTELPLIEVHLNAVQHHRLPARAHDLEGAAASMIVFAPEALTIPEGMVWPDGAADLPKPGEQIDKERPICTLLARAGSGDQARSLVRAEARQLLAALNVVEDPA